MNYKASHLRYLVNSLTDWLFGYVMFILVIMFSVWAWTWPSPFGAIYYFCLVCYLIKAFDHYTDPKNMRADYLTQREPTFAELEREEYDRRADIAESQYRKLHGLPMFQPSNFE